MWRTGHSFLKKKNQEVKAAFIGELSGHFFFSEDFYNHDDGVYSTLRLLRYLSHSGKSLSEAVALVPRYISSPEVKIYCDDDKKADLVTKLSLILRKDYPQAEIIDDERAGDGIRLEVEDAMFVVRYSQNGPYLTVKFEAKTEKHYEELKNYLYNVLKKFTEIGWDSKINVNIGAFM
jgi:phosphomannomutase/phosphoglucomutase